MPKSYISQITLPGGTTYDIKDAEARDLIAAIAAGGITFKVSTDAATTPAGLTWDNEGTTVTGTLVASSDTKADVYLVPHAKNATTHKVDFYREYVTVNFGTKESPSYAWEFLGDTDIDLSGLGDLAYKDAATGSISVTQPTGSGSFSGATVNTSASYTPAGSISVTLGQTATAADLTKGDYTPAGSVSVTLDQTSTAASVSRGDYTPAGTVSTPTITVTPSTTSVDVLDTDGSVTAGSAASFTRGSFNGGSFTQGTDQFSAGSFSATVAENTEVLTLSFTAPTFTQGTDSFTAATHGDDTFVANTPTSVTLPTFTPATVVDGIASAASTQPTFTGTKETGLKVTGVSYDKASVDSASFTGTKAENVLVTGVSYDKASVSAQTFTGTAATIESEGTASGSVTVGTESVSKNITVQ